MIEHLIALRFITGKKRRMITFSNGLSLAGIFLGVFALLVVSSVMNGFDSDMRDRVIGSKAEIHVHNSDHEPLSNYEAVRETILQNKEVVAAAPVCAGELMIQKDENILATLNYGVRMEDHRHINKVFSSMVVGAPTEEELQADGIIIGLDMSLTLNATVGEYVTLTFPVGTEPTPFGLMPRSKRLKVIGLFVSGLPDYDQLHSYISLENGQYFQGLKNQVSHIDVKTKDPRYSHRTAQALNRVLPAGVEAEDWSQFESNLFNAIKMEKVVMFVVLALMILIASFNMTGNFTKLVAEKRMDIGVLKALGAEDALIGRVFVRIGLLLGTMGVLCGTLAALGLLLAQQHFHFITLPMAGFQLQWLPVELRLSDFLLVPMVALILCYLTTLSPAKRTTAIPPISIIRHS
ncbi:MAG: ABC transporter permease [Candidatus Cloacimonetes bacterium]|nr:ABC transporter permease [Candidatus Cloacimonadota bacterium]